MDSEAAKRRSRVVEHDDARVLLGRVGQHMAEVYIGSHEASPFAPADARDHFMRLSFQSLPGDSRHVVAAWNENLRKARREALVHLEAELQEAMSITTDRSRVISAA